MIHRLTLALASALLVTACAASKPLEASATIEEIPNAPSDAGTQAPPQARLIPVETPDGFNVAMPAEPQVARNKVAIKAGEVTTASWTVNQDGILYSVSIADYPAAFVSGHTAGVFLNDGRNGLVNQLKGTLKGEEDITLDGHPGKAFKVSAEAGDVSARNYLVGARLYTLLVLYSPNLGAPLADEFLASLKLTAPVAPVAKQPATVAGDGGTPMSMDGGMEMSADAGTESMPADAGTPAAKPARKKKK